MKKQRLCIRPKNRRLCIKFKTPEVEIEEVSKPFTINFENMNQLFLDHNSELKPKVCRDYVSIMLKLNKIVEHIYPHPDDVIVPDEWDTYLIDEWKVHFQKLKPSTLIKYFKACWSVISKIGGNKNFVMRLKQERMLHDAKNLVDRKEKDKKGLYSEVWSKKAVPALMKCIMTCTDRSVKAVAILFYHGIVLRACELHRLSFKRSNDGNYIDLDTGMCYIPISKKNVKPRQFKLPNECVDMLKVIAEKQNYVIVDGSSPYHQEDQFNPRWNKYFIDSRSVFRNYVEAHDAKYNKDASIGFYIRGHKQREALNTYAMGSRGKYFEQLLEESEK